MLGLAPVVPTAFAVAPTLIDSTLDQPSLVEEKSHEQFASAKNLLIPLLAEPSFIKELTKSGYQVNWKEFERLGSGLL